MIHRQKLKQPTKINKTKGKKKEPITYEKRVFSSRFKETDSGDLIGWGKLFQSSGATTAKAQSPLVLR